MTGRRPLAVNTHAHYISAGAKHQASSSRTPSFPGFCGERPLPHVYHDPLRLCLTLPGTREWTGTMRIDQTFVPWATTWLYHFEDWLISDD